MGAEIIFRAVLKSFAGIDYSHIQSKWAYENMQVNNVLAEINIEEVDESLIIK